MENFATMKIRLIDTLTFQNTIEKCCICQSSFGQRLCCMEPTCTLVAHAFCSFKEKVNKLYENSTDDSGWTMQLLLGAQPSKNSMDQIKKYINKGVIPDYLSTPRKELETLSQSMEENKAKNDKMETRSSKRIAVTPKTPELEQIEVKNKNTFLSSIGGCPNIYCELHKPPHQFCICAKKPRPKKSDELMVCCDNCGKLYIPKLNRQLVSC